MRVPLHHPSLALSGRVPLLTGTDGVLATLCILHHDVKTALFSCDGKTLHTTKSQTYLDINANRGNRGIPSKVVRYSVLSRSLLNSYSKTRYER